MSRLAPRLATSLAILLAALGSPVLAADRAEDTDDSGGFRGSYSDEPKNWSGLGTEDDTIHIETGVRYWYSMGAQKMSLNGANYEVNDTSHIGEAYIRLDDDASRTYAKGWAGYSMAIGGSYDNPSVSGDVTDGKIGYAGADFGWNAFGDGNGSGVGAFVGYQYWNDSPRTDRTSYTTARSTSDISWNPNTGDWSVGGDSQDSNFELDMLRLGFSGKAVINDFFDISAEVAAVPYARISGTQGGMEDSSSFSGPGCGSAPPAPCPAQPILASAVSVDGWGYGGMAEVMAGIHPTENLTFRLGARAWYVGGTYDATYTGVFVTPPQYKPEVDDPNSVDPLDTIPDTPPYSGPSLTSQEFISTENPFSLFRYGLLAEMTYSF